MGSWRQQRLPTWCTDGTERKTRRPPPWNEGAASHSHIYTHWQLFLMWRKHYDTLQSEKIVSLDLLINALSVPVWSLFSDIMRSHDGYHGITECVSAVGLFRHMASICCWRNLAFISFLYFICSQHSTFINYECNKDHIWARHCWSLCFFV